MTDKSIFKFVVLAFFIIFTLAAIGLFVAAFRRITVGSSAGTYAVAGVVSTGFIRLILMAIVVGVIVITFLVKTRRKLK